MNQYGINYGYHMNQAPFRPGATEQRMNESNIQMPGDWCTITYYECDVQVRSTTLYSALIVYLRFRLEKPSEFIPISKKLPLMDSLIQLAMIDSVLVNYQMYTEKINLKKFECTLAKVSPLIWILLSVMFGSRMKGIIIIYYLKHLLYL